MAGFPRGGSPSNIQLTFTEQEKKEYNEIVKEVNRIAKLVKEGKMDYEQYVDARNKEVEYRYRKYDELAGETMSRNVERRRELSPKQRREKTLESTMDVNLQDQKILYQEKKNIAIKEKKVEGKKKPEERRGIFGIFKKRKQKGDTKMNWSETPIMNMNESPIVKRKNTVENAARKLSEGKITQEKFREVVRKDSPINPIGELFEPPTEEHMNIALGKKSEKIMAPVTSRKVGLRLDIPAYKRHNAWIVTGKQIVLQ